MSKVASLTALTGRHLIQEASCFFEELQADLSSINIHGDNVDELWCLLDWHRYILAVWSEQARNASTVSEKKWINVKESWETIIQATVSLNLRYAFPSKEDQRSTLLASTDSLSFEKSLHSSRYDGVLPKQDQIMIESIVKATCEDAWATPLFHETAFSGLIDSVIDTRAETGSSVKDEMKRGSSSIQSVEFMKFIQVLHGEIKLLIASSPAEEQDGLYAALSRAFRKALSDNEANKNTRSLHFFHSLTTSWPLNKQASQLAIDEIFQTRVQDLFGSMISPSYCEQSHRSAPYSVEDLQQIIALGADVRGEVDGRNDCTLWAAAGSESSIDLFKALVHAGAPYTTEPNSNCSPLQAAACAGRLDIVAFLVTRGQHHFDIDINARDHEGRTALYAAADGCYESIIDLLFQQPNIDLDLQDHYGYTPFLWTVRNTDAKRLEKYSAIRRFIRNKSVDCNLATDYTRDMANNALHLAAMSRDAALKIIVKHVRGINAQNFDGGTPLHKAVECNSKPNIEILLKHGADPTIVDKNGLTPLLLACEKRYLGPMELLLSLPHSLSDQCPAPIRKSDDMYSSSRSDLRDHWSPVTLVLRDIAEAGKKKRAHIRLALKTLLAAGADLEVRDGEGRSVLSRVIKFIDRDMLQDLLQAGADVNSQDDKGKSVLNRAMKSVNMDEMHLLLQPGTDVNLRDNAGRTPLYRLFKNSNVNQEKAILLLERGADPDIQDINGRAAVPANWERRHKRRYESLIEVIRQCRVDRIRRQREKSLQALAQQTKTYATRQKQKENEKRKSHSASNPFSILTVEGEELTEDALEP